jgi:hypothetical protein
VGGWVVGWLGFGAREVVVGRGGKARQDKGRQPGHPPPIHASTEHKTQKRKTRKRKRAKGKRRTFCQYWGALDGTARRASTRAITCSSVKYPTSFPFTILAVTACCCGCGFLAPKEKEGSFTAGAALVLVFFAAGLVSLGMALRLSRPPALLLLLPPPVAAGALSRVEDAPLGWKRLPRIISVDRPVCGCVQPG